MTRAPIREWLKQQYREVHPFTDAAGSALDTLARCARCR